MVTFLPKGCITLEEHTTLLSLGDESPFYTEIWKTFPNVRQALLDKHDRRLVDMDTGHVSFQILSQLPGIGNENPDGCRASNDELAGIVQNNPTRFGGFAALAMAYPDEAAQELERAVTQLGLLGAMIDNHLPDMSHYDSEKYWAVFETAERLDVPIYIHPAPASKQAMAERFQGNYTDIVATGLSTGAWGWHENLGLHVVKLYAAGLFKQFPNLKLIIGHMGEMIPMMIDRIDRLKFFKKEGLGSFSEVWEKNIWVTTSGIFSVRTLEMLLKVTPLGHILYSVDTPFERSETGWEFIERIKKSGILTDSELEDFVYGNAKKLLKIAEIT
ncbi:hypothetical protein BGW36DRAFT_381638 [Talaromyces proteolyticus]|uniref:Amidohydrolase-related domain-containing protein n=1 Tax=Talaromyces proteolyticus TaxID=1131652 RepID=A0AAD4PWA7_9EURO|nr:uncharacterized protein BGW36DRAFT_381638 [Talaromyces proteolyticus]KAH8694885.1 hypothetical protein BGW36DRAFT_381638 [Talaromyces proteolyticus]